MVIHREFGPGGLRRAHAEAGRSCLEWYSSIPIAGFVFVPPDDVLPPFSGFRKAAAGGHIVCSRECGICFRALKLAVKTRKARTLRERLELKSPRKRSTFAPIPSQVEPLLKNDSVHEPYLPLKAN